MVSPELDKSYRDSAYPVSDAIFTVTERGVEPLSVPVGESPA